MSAKTESQIILLHRVVGHTLVRHEEVVAFLKCGILVPVVAAGGLEIDVEIIPYKFETDVGVRINKSGLLYISDAADE